MEAYLVQRGRRALFDDAEFFNGCSKLSVMVGDRDTTVLLAKLYAEQMIASKGRKEENLPQNIPDLMLLYLNELNRKEGGLADRAVHSAAKTIAWECLRQNFRPTPASIDAVLLALGEDNAEQRIKYLEQKLRLVQVIGLGRDWVRFALDPLAEYLAGLYVVEHYGDNEQLWGKFLAQADDTRGAPDTVRGFLLAVRDCCIARAGEQLVLDSVLGELGKRLGLDPDFGESIRTKQRVGRLVALLDSPDANDRATALNILCCLGERAAPAVPALIKALKDEDWNVRAEAADALACTGNPGQEAILALRGCLNDSDIRMRYYSAVALAHLGCTDDAVISGLVELLRCGKGPREEGLKALAHMGPQARAAIPALTDVLSDEFEDYVILGVEALGAIGPEAREAVSSLERLAESHGSEKVRLAAAEGLRAIRS
jgi:HEAT repeat protein